MNGDEVVSTKKYELGDNVEFPEDPVLFSDENYEYSFLGWTFGENTKDFVSSHVVSEDVTFYASYAEVPIVSEDKKSYVVTFRDSRTGLPIK